MSESPTYVNDTIAAVATASGKGGIGIVRISGPAVEGIAAKMLGALPPPRRAVHTAFHDRHGAAVDEGLALYFPAPHSFTGESVLELHGHGGPLVMSMLVEAALEFGARRAAPGEFSKRAFLNGKLDLAQTEAIADLIDSGTKQAARAALRTMTGGFSRAVEALQEKITLLRVHVEAAIDFPDDDIDFLADDALQQRVRDCADAFAALRRQAGIGRLLRDGLQAVIVGRPNAGKSSLLNFLSGEDSAIVTEIAGTTRDVLREQIDIDGMLVELVDTAGIREDPDVIEAEGIRRAKAALEAADVILWIKDSQDTEATLDLPEAAHIIELRNKCDLSGATGGFVSRQPPVLNISAKTGAGIDDLRTALRETAGFIDSGEGAWTARQRHIDALASAARHFEAGQRALSEDRAGELFAEELRLAQAALAEIGGRLSSDELLGRIFAEFCIGK